MPVGPSRRVPKEAAATPDEIVAAIEKLTPAEWAKLRRSADLCVLKLGPKALRKTADELLQTAVTDLLEDTRRWDRSKVPVIVHFLIWAMKRISSNWARAYRPEKSPVLETELIKEDEEGKLTNPVAEVRENSPDPERQFRNKQTLEAISKLFNDDEEAQMVLTAWEEGYDPPGVRELWGLSQKDYNRIVQRIRRKLDAAGIVAD